MLNTVTLICGNKRADFIFEGRKTVFDLMRENNSGGLKFKINAPCGGKKTCGKCKVKIKTGLEFISEPDKTEKTFLTESDIKENIRYACMCEVFGNAVIELPELSPDEKIEVQTEGLKSSGITADKFKKITVALSESTLKNPISDEKNLISEINKIMGLNIKNLPVKIIRKLSEIKNQDVSNNKIDVILNDGKIIDVRKSSECEDIYGAAVDIGTTTTAVYLYSLTTDRLIGVASDENPQRTYGADVISRINYIIENKNGLYNLKRLILSLVFKLINDLCKNNNISSNDIYSVVLTGNTVMQHIAAGISPKNIAFTPFTAATLFGFDISAEELLNEIDNISNINETAVIYFPPAFASYVGGDIATGIIASDTDLYESEKSRLFLDVGTNGEIGLGNKDSLVFCATATGPAFEGAHIKLGMAGVKGAVNKIELDESNNIAYETIGNISPKGICGSGIIDAVALMLEIGVLDETGRILDGGDTDGMPEKYKSFEENLCEIDGENAFFIDKKHNIYLTQKDVRAIQLAKAAVSAGILTLLNHAGKSLSDVGEFILAGGFGAHIDKKNACKIGLIPAELEDKIITAGNTAGMGAAAVLLDCSAVERINKISEISTYIELSGNAFWLDEYVERMMF